ncbi:MAG: hypothetical protein ACLQCU_14440 [Acidimicrobiales bacterium]
MVQVGKLAGRRTRKPSTWGVLPALAWAFAGVLMYRRYRRPGPFIVVHVFWDAGLPRLPFFGGGPLVAECCCSPHRHSCSG